MFGKFFASAFTGSMFGAGADVFAVWGYVIANTVASQVELNPNVIAAVIGMTPQAVEDAIEKLCAPDPRSRSKVAEGRRLVREGEYAYHVPNHDKYRAVRSEEDRRAYNREAQQKYRLKQKASRPVNNPVIDSQSLSTLSAQAEADTEAETEAESSSSSSAKEELLNLVPRRESWEAEMNASLEGMHGPLLTPEQLERACSEYLGNGAQVSPNLKHFRAYLRDVAKPVKVAVVMGDDAVIRWAKEKDAKEAAEAAAKCQNP